MASGDQEEALSVTRFRQYLRINTAQPTPDYAKASEFYQNYAAELGLNYRKVELSEDHWMDVLTCPGTDHSLSSIMLYCHTDVVPCFPDKWTHPPFSAHKDEEGNIYARGAQDMKCLGIQYLEAIRALKTQGEVFKCTIHVVFGPDEEIGGNKGMCAFVKTQEFKDMNIAFSLDEGIASPGEAYRVFYAERFSWWLEVTCEGQPGHASQFIEDTCGAKMNKVVSSFLEFRTEQENKLKDNPELTIGDVITLNFTFVQGGVQYNVIPDKMVAGFDMRMPPSTDARELEERVRNWCEDAGRGVTYKFLSRDSSSGVTRTDASNPWWTAFKSVFDKLGLELKAEVFPAGTDSRYVRKLGIPALGFSPMTLTPILLHDHNEFLNEKVFLRGIEIYQHLLKALANVQ